MNKVLFAVFRSESTAESGLRALHSLHATGHLKLRAVGVMLKDAHGQVGLTKSVPDSVMSLWTAKATLRENGSTELAQLGYLPAAETSPAAFKVSPLMTRAVREFWSTGVGMDVVELAERHLAPGSLGLLAEVDEMATAAVDAALATAGGRIFRLTRAELTAAQLRQEGAALAALVA